MKKLFVSLLIALCGAVPLFADESKGEMQRICTECEFIVKNKLTGGRLVCRIDDNSKRRIKIILKKGYFTQDLGVRNIKITRGHIEFKGRNGSLIFYPGEEFCFIAKLPTATICSEKFKFDSYSGFFMSQYPDIEKSRCTWQGLIPVRCWISMNANLPKGECLRNSESTLRSLFKTTVPSS